MIRTVRTWPSRRRIRRWRPVFLIPGGIAGGGDLVGGDSEGLSHAKYSLSSSMPAAGIDLPGVDRVKPDLGQVLSFASGEFCETHGQSVGDSKVHVKGIS